MLTEDKSYVGFLIADTARLMRTIFDRRAREIGLTRSQWLVVRRLYRHPGASQSELADMMEIEKASAGRLIDRLERNGWVQRRPDATDRRINRLFLTKRAVQVNAQIHPIAEEMVEEALEGMSKADREKLTELVTHFKERLQAMAEAGAPDAEPETEPKDDKEYEARALDLA